MYTWLSKLFHKDSKQYQFEFEKRFNNSSAKKIDFPYLSETTFFVITEEIFNLCYRIQKKDKDILGIIGGLPGIALKQFMKKCLIDEIFQTNDIEGVRSTRKEIKETIEFSGKEKSRWYGIVRKYQKLNDDDNLNINRVSAIRELYDELVSEEVEKEDPKDALDGLIFRKNSVSVVTSEKEIHRGLNPEEKIIGALEKALLLLNDREINPLIRIAIFHYMFGFIHPFYNGNGRVSRFISSYYLAKELNQFVGYRLSYTINMNKNEYYKAFDITNKSQNKGELTGFIIMFLNTLEKSMNNLFLALNDRYKKISHYLEILEHTHTIDSDLKELCSILIQAELFAEDGISTEELQNALESSYGTMKNKVEKLKEIDESIVKINRIGRAKYYSLNLEVFIKVCETSE